MSGAAADYPLDGPLDSRTLLLIGERINQSGSWTWDVGQGVVNCSAGFCRIYELDPCVSASDFDALVQHIDPRDRNHVIRTLGEAVAQQRTARFEYRIVAANGETRHLSVIGQPMLETGGKVYVGTVSDISSRKADEGARSEAQAELARGARRATVHQMAAVIAHEVNQPLMSISSNAWAALVRLQRDSLDAAKLEELLRAIIGQSQRAGTVIQTLQALAYRRPRSEPIDLHTLVPQVLLIMRGELDRHHIAVELDLRDQPISLEGDPHQLRQVFANLVSNAVDAMREVQGRERMLRIASRTIDSNQVEVCVEDNGVGAATSSTYEQMFEPFAGTKPDGVGMGLAICRSIIERHGGRIGARGRQPYGCSVTFTLAEPAGIVSCWDRPGEST
ncbi:sensor histidine kinase [Massilia niabensis]|uniref:histidine kinase n=1 Tax=Massilia niabensis TaxID=544910 RepID=A0ABW0L7Q4_9BURK